MAKKKKRVAKKAKRKRAGLRSYTRSYSSLLYAGKQLDYSLTDKLKAEPFHVINHVLDATRARRPIVLGNLFPSSLRMMSKSPPTSFTGNLEAEINWTGSTILRYAKQLKTFVLKKHEFECSLLRGDFGDSLRLLKDIAKEFKFSLWAIEAELLIHQLQGGLEHNRELLKRYLKEKNARRAQVLTYFYSERIEDAMSTEEYDLLCGFLKQSETGSPLSATTRSHVQFRVNYHRFEDVDLLASLINAEEAHSLIDRYLAFIRIIQRLCIEGTDGLPRNASELIVSLSDAVNDSRVDLMAAILEPDSIRPTALSSRLLAVLHEYTLGNYSEVQTVAIQAIRDNPGMFDFYELAAKAIIRSNVVPLPFPNNSIPHIVLSGVVNVLNGSEHKTPSLQKLLKLSYQTDCLSLGPQLFAFCRQHMNDNRPLRDDRFSIFSSSAITPRLSVAFADHSKAIQYLQTLQQCYPHNAAVELFLSTRLSVSEKRYRQPGSSLPHSRLCKYRAYVLETLRDFRSALDVYIALEHLAADNPLLAADSITGQYRCHLRLGQIQECTLILANAVVTQPNIVSGATLLEVLDVYSTSREEAFLKNLAWSLLFCSSQQQGLKPVNPEIIHNVLDDFLTAWGVERPSEIKGISTQFAHDHVLYFLRYVCVPEVLEWSPWYDTQEELEQERATICAWLNDIDSENQAIYNKEIAELARRGTMRDLFHKVDRSRIYVDTQGIRNALPSSSFDRALRCLSYSRLSKDLRNGLDLQNDVEQLGFDKVVGGSVVIIDAAFGLFKGLFNELKREFIASSEYGLDANLSQRIRHGKLSGEIHALFEESHFVTKTDTKGRYLENEYWLKRFGISDEGLATKISKAFSALSKCIDAHVHTVRSQWIQIKAPANNGIGMFDYDFEDAELYECYDLLAGLVDADSFFTFVFDRLWDRTEKDLQRVRNAIQTDLKRLLFEGLDDLQAELDICLSDQQSSDLRSAITTFKTNLINGLESLSDWFRVDKSQQMQDFQMSVLLDALLVIVNRCSGPCRLEVRRSLQSDDLLPGVLFLPLWDMLFILLDNAAKYSQKEVTGVDLSFDRSDTTLELKVINDLGSDVDIAALQSRIDRLARRPDDDRIGSLISGEGGTGLFKLKNKIIPVDLKCTDSTCNLTLTQEGRFAASVVLRALSLDISEGNA